MGPLGVVEVDPFADDLFSPEAIGQFVQVDGLVFEQPPEPLDEDVVHAAAPAIHRDRHTGILERAHEVEAGELAALVRVEDPRLAVSGHGFFESLDAERRIHGVRQPPNQDMAARPVHDRYQIQETTLDRDVGDVGAPNLVGTIDLQAFEKVGVNPMGRMGRAGSRCLIDGLQAHQPQLAGHPPLR